jgi:hypothetical protein
MVRHERRELDEVREQAHTPSATRATRDEEPFDVVRSLLRSDVVRRALKEHLGDTDQRQPLAMRERLTRGKSREKAVSDVFKRNPHSNLTNDGIQ